MTDDNVRLKPEAVKASCGSPHCIRTPHAFVQVSHGDMDVVARHCVVGVQNLPNARNIVAVAICDTKDFVTAQRY